MLLQLTLTVAAMCSPLFMRHVDGTLTAALKDRGFDFDGQVSMIQMGVLAGAAGGWDYLMATTYWSFCIVCPVVRPSRCCCCSTRRSGSGGRSSTG